MIKSMVLMLLLFFTGVSQAYHSEIECELEGPPRFVVRDFEGTLGTYYDHFLIDACGNETFLFRDGPWIW